MERMRAVGEMTSGIAHDFNKLITPIEAYSELLLHEPERLNDKVKARQYLSLIHTAAEDAASLRVRLKSSMERPSRRSCGSC